MDEQPRLGDPTDMTEQVLAGGAGGLAQRMEIELVLCSSARVVARMPVEGNTQPYGLLHGGASVVLAETLGSIGSAVHAHSLGKIAVGLDINATHHRAARSGWVTGTAARASDTAEVIVVSAETKRFWVAGSPRTAKAIMPPKPRPPNCRAARR